MRTPVLNQNPLSLPSKDPPPVPPQQSPEAVLRLEDQRWLLSLLKKCNSMKELNQVHCQFLKLGFFFDSFCARNLISTCALSNWGSMDYACSVFEQIHEPNTFDFNTMIRGYVKELNFEECLYLYKEMLRREIQPDNFTYPVLLKACSKLGAIKEGMQIHDHIIKLGLENDVFVQNSLIYMYGKCNEIEQSLSIFKHIDRKSVASWSAIISAHATIGLWWECLELFERMSGEGFCRAEESLLVSLISACTHLSALDLGRCIHGALLRNIKELNVTIETSLIDMYVKCGCLEKGSSLFRKMEKKNELSYSVMISGLAINGQGREALRVFSQMVEEEGLVPDEVVYVGVLNACSNAGLVKEGLYIFDKMKTKHGIEPMMEHYGCMVDLLGKAGMLEEAFEFINKMPVNPNDIVWRSLLNACRIHNNLKLGKIVAKILFQLNPNNPGDYLVISNMYAKAQEWERVGKIMTEMANKGLVQTPGFSSVEVNRRVYRFVSMDRSNRTWFGTYEMIHQIEWQLRFEGYLADTSQVVMFDEEEVGKEEEKRERLKGHSQKLAIAFALINTSKGSKIKIIRNVRMCSDCHTYTKFISSIYGREIVVRDRNRFHCFKNGTCSCGDYW